MTLLIWYVGIGQGRITDNVQGAPIDSAVHIPDQDAVAMVCMVYTMVCMILSVFV